MCRCLIAVVLWSVLNPVCVCGFPTEPSTSWIHPYLDELRIRHADMDLFVSNGPYDRLEIARWLRSAYGGSPPVQKRSLWMLRLLETELRSEFAVLENQGWFWTQEVRVGAGAEKGGPFRSDGWARFSLHSGTGLCVWTTIRATVNSPERHKIETRPWHQRLRASFDQGGIGFQRGSLSIFAGRDEISWGAARQRGLLFSGSAPAFDMVKLRLGMSPVQFTAFHSQLRRGQDDSWEPAVRRYVAGHRLDFLLGGGLRFSVSEAVVYGGENRTFEPRYLNPLGVFYAEQWNSRQNDNIFIGGDFSLHFRGIGELRGEILLDDFQYDFETEPHECGFAISAVGKNPFYSEASLIGCSYHHVRNMVYGHLVNWNRLTHEGHVMGYPDGPDGDRLALWSSLMFPEPVRWQLGYTLRRKGEGEATDSQEGGGRKVKFPSGSVEVRHSIGLDLVLRPSYAWMVEGFVEWYNEDNTGNIRDEARSGFNVEAKVTFNLRMAYK